MSAAIIAAIVLYVLFAPPSKPSYVRFAHGGLARLEVLAHPPTQPREMFFDSQGRPHRLADFRGEIILVNLWATWCNPCVGEMPTLGALQRRYAGRIRVVAVSVDGQNKSAEAQAELARLSGGALRYYEDPTRRILFSAQADPMPTTILYDRQGRERARAAGAANWSSPEANAFIDAALAQE